MSALGHDRRLVLKVSQLFYRDGLSTVITGTLIAPFIAIVATLIYYRLTESSRVDSGAGYQQPF